MRLHSQATTLRHESLMSVIIRALAHADGKPLPAFQPYGSTEEVEVEIPNDEDDL